MAIRGGSLAEAGGVRSWVGCGHALEHGQWISRIALGTCRAQGRLWGVLSRAHPTVALRPSPCSARGLSWLSDFQSFLGFCLC